MGATEYGEQARIVVRRSDERTVNGDPILVDDTDRAWLVEPMSQASRAAAGMRCAVATRWVVFLSERGRVYYIEKASLWDARSDRRQLELVRRIAGS